MTKELTKLIGEMESGSVRALARLISLVENRRDGWMDVMRKIYPLTGKARVVGITGSPGAGKSTLTDRMIADLVDKGLSVGVIAVDPSSPFSGGALLGDRLRMKKTSLLEGVFVRSMATRGALGGLSLAARDVIKIMDASGKDIILVETVGVGQAEVEIVRAADLVMVVCVPGMGDGIQAIKAGIMEIADIFVVNKADKEGVDRAVGDIQGMLALSSFNDSPTIPVMKTTAVTGEGVQALIETLLKSIKFQKADPIRQKERIREEILGLMEREVSRVLHRNWVKNGKLDNALKKILAQEIDPYSIVEEMVVPLIQV
ncbi:methylmalonyl Co-A mutase-associated GTPase MeaB [Desulfobacula sp.]|uniref:methylmalonyl Co-A mutase-associated GTPase MeaB n=1 Tax=Desulfobacula sp. TaxID=2593537 RepID=UPI0026164A0E|nr:methylmalonyl Co-A mutase-associated GTPase MeaB [Desulfobacula sp.]